ncbi:MAG: hypothetical protein CMM77_11785 [Rhodospirillaceae bacterium]|nr:hypothetical protein [Magnetovibrio sp.]MAY67798.1 hypothetical protein [Rhodospirillaceae bacterium]
MTGQISNPQIDAAYAQVDQLLARNRAQDALALLAQILTARPNDPPAFCGVGRASILLGDNNAALQALDMALAGDPDLMEAHNARGVALHNLGRLSEAEQAFNRVLEVHPENPGARTNLAALLASRGDYAGARAMYQALADAHPGIPNVVYNLSLLDLIEGDFAAGWRGFEMRQKAAYERIPWRDLQTPRWQGEHAPEATLFVHAEQGLGDHLQFARFLPEAAARVGRLVVEAPGPLVEMFSGIPGVGMVVDREASVPDHDVQVPIMSLAGALGLTTETEFWRGPYLAADAERTDAWRSRIGQGDGRLHVGLIWSGNPHHPRDRERSISAETLAPVLTASGVAFHSLQVGPEAEPIRKVPGGEGVRPLFPEMLPFAEVAAAISALDLVIGVDTALIHLAGALGRPVWTLITHVPDWRWMLRRGDSPWYPSMRLFRQPEDGDWASVIDAVGRDLMLGGIDRNGMT